MDEQRADDRPMPVADHPVADIPVEEGARKREPAINLPSSLVIALAVLVAIHAIRLYVLTPQADNRVILDFAFFPARYAMPLADQGLVWLWSPVTYSLLHGGWDHVLFNSFWMVAFGAPVVRRIGAPRFCIFWCVSAAAAVAFHSMFHWGEVVPVIGASGVVSALMGAAARFVFSPSGGISRESAHLNPLLPIGAALSHRSVLAFAGVLFISNLLIGLGAFALGGTATIAWEAHIGGFLFGFLLFAPFDRRLRLAE